MKSVHTSTKQHKSLLTK